MVKTPLQTISPVGRFVTKNFLKRPAAADSVSSKRGDKKQLEKGLRAPLHSEGKAQSSVVSNVGQPARVWEIAQMPEGEGLEGHNGNPTLVKEPPKLNGLVACVGWFLKLRLAKVPSGRDAMTMLSVDTLSKSSRSILFVSTSSLLRPRK